MWALRANRETEIINLVLLVKMHSRPALHAGITIIIKKVLSAAIVSYSFSFCAAGMIPKKNISDYHTDAIL